MATREEMEKAGVDPAVFLAYEKTGNSSIRALDGELRRLLPSVSALGLDRDVAVAFLSDYGEEFHEHADVAHGQSVHGRAMHVPLVIRVAGRTWT